MVRVLQIFKKSRSQNEVLNDSHVKKKTVMNKNAENQHEKFSHLGFVDFCAR
jgi:hypothetical protein